MKVKGSELILFMAEAWPSLPHADCWYWDHDLFDDPDPEAIYETNDIGGLYFQPANGFTQEHDPTDGDGYDLASLIRKWRKSRIYDLVTLQVPKGKYGDVEKVLAAANLGVKIEKPKGLSAAKA